MKPASVEEYIAGFPKPVQALLRKVRRTIRAAAPDAREVISYKMPAYKQHGMIVYFAGFKGHIGLFPPVRGNAALEKAVRRYAGPKGNLRFAYKEALPLGLVSRIVRLKVKQDRDRAALRKKKRTR
ncbi:MAG: DUF1801 domain-containing protein [Steroidobacteraceae bacterium]|nr:DUF1801 domain-containing protein [Steroidobacteraceae bacterium]